jgi:hypothetical protein
MPMPTLAELRSRFQSDAQDAFKAGSAEESLIADVRRHLRPAQIVEAKLRTLLQVRERQPADRGISGNGQSFPKKPK